MFYKKAKLTAGILAAMMTAAVTLTGCSTGTAEGAAGTSAVSQVTAAEDNGKVSDEAEKTEEKDNAGEDTAAASGEAAASAGSSVLDTADLFTERDLTQTADLTEAVTYTVKDGEDIHIAEEGVYVLQGTASEVTVYVEAEDTAKVQLVLDGVSITNTDKPCIYAVSGDKVFVTTSSDSSLTVSDSFAEDEEHADAAIFSCQDLVLNGTSKLTIQSGDGGVDSKDDLKITGGTYEITAEKKALEANDSIRICDGTFVLNAGTDGLHAENDEDDSQGVVYISGGTFTVTAGDDGIHGESVVQIDGGSISIDAVEGIEGTYVQLNGGTFEINASDDGINAAQKSTSYAVTIEITGGEYTIVMAAGDTDALDSNGDLIISGGTLDITAMSAFDYDGTGTYTGGTLIVNGEETTELTQSMMGGGMQPGGQTGERPSGDGMQPGGQPGERPSGDGTQPGGRPGGEPAADGTQQGSKTSGSNQASAG